MTSDLQEVSELWVLDVERDVEGRFVELAERVHVGSVFDKKLSDVVVPVLSGPVQRRHLQHVFSVHIRSILNTHTHTFN